MSNFPEYPRTFVAPAHLRDLEELTLNTLRAGSAEPKRYRGRANDFRGYRERSDRQEAWWCIISDSQKRRTETVRATYTPAWLRLETVVFQPKEYMLGSPIKESESVFLSGHHSTFGCAKDERSDTQETLIDRERIPKLDTFKAFAESILLRAGVILEVGEPVRMRQSIERYGEQF